MPKQSKKKSQLILTPEAIRERLKLKHIRAVSDFQERYPEVNKFLTEKGLTAGKIRDHSAKLIGASIITGSLLLSPGAPTPALPSPQDVLHEETTGASKDSQKALVDTFTKVLPEKTRPLSREEEKFLESVIMGTTGVKAKATLEGEHLNTTYGRIGLEQHLRRFPGDTIGEHGEGKVLRQGMAPGLGAWGYFAKSREELTPQLAETEKWYAVVQTLYLPDWNTRQPHLKNWYKHRKVLILNTKNGNAVVAAIADSGPAAWTGKHFGGSPEVMMHLGGERYTKGPVILFFVDDPENQVPLGPVSYQEVSSKLIEIEAGR